MTDLFVIVHVVVVIVSVGPITVAASMFPAAARDTATDPTDRAVQLRMLHRVCRVYSAVAVAVPAFGVVAAFRLHVWGQAWLIVAVALTAIAATLLVTLILPAQRRTLDQFRIDGPRDARIGAGAIKPHRRPDTDSPHHGDATVSVRRLAAAAGGFNLLWVAIVALMLTQPGAPAGS